MQLGVSLGIPYSLGKPAAAFSPLDLSPVLWLDASDTSTITESGGAVSQWDDKSGNANHVAQATAALQPTTGTVTINGLNVLDFTSDLLANSPVTISGTQPITVFVVAQPDGDQYGRLFRAGGGGAGDVTVAYLTSGRMIEATSTALISSTSQYTGGTTYLSRFVMDGASSSIHMNAVSIATGDAGTNNLSTQTVANVGAFDSTTQMFDGKIAEIIMTADGALTAGEIADTEAYLADKWGITI